MECVVKFVDMLKTQAIDIDEVSESYTSFTDPFDGEKLKKRKQVVEKVVKVLNPYLMTAHEGGEIKVFKVGIWRVVKLFWKGILLPHLTWQERWMGGY
jgi:hypothetical protein